MELEEKVYATEATLGEPQPVPISLDSCTWRSCCLAQGPAAQAMRRQKEYYLLSTQEGEQPKQL